MSSIAFYVTLMIVGGVLVFVSRTLSKHDEGEWKWGFWTREFVNGPPGYRRAISSLLGIVLGLIGIAGVMYTIFYTAEK